MPNIVVYTVGDGPSFLLGRTRFDGADGNPHFTTREEMRNVVKRVRAADKAGKDRGANLGGVRTGYVNSDGKRSKLSTRKDGYVLTFGSPYTHSPYNDAAFSIGCMAFNEENANLIRKWAKPVARKTAVTARKKNVVSISRARRKAA